MSLPENTCTIHAPHNTKEPTSKPCASHKLTRRKNKQPPQSGCTETSKSAAGVEMKLHVTNV